MITKHTLALLLFLRYVFIVTRNERVYFSCSLLNNNYIRTISEESFEGLTSLKYL